MMIERLITDIITSREAVYTNQIFNRLVSKIAEKYHLQVIEYYLIKIEKIQLNKRNFLRVKSSKISFKTRDLETAFQVRNLLHASGYKNSKVIPNENSYIIEAEAPDNMVLSISLIKRLEKEDNVRQILIKILKDIFLRNIKRIKLLLKNIKF